MTRARPGIALQELVAALERALAQSDGVTIESPKFLPDKDTGKMREHDVVITRCDAHHTILTAIEVKDTGRKVGVPQIEAFSKKCEKTGVHHRVMVSGSGFTKTALTKAGALDIACIHLSEAEAFDWMGLEFFVRIERNIPHVNATVFFKTSQPPEPFKVVDRNGVEVTPPHLASIIFEAMRENNIEAPVDQDTPISVHADTEKFCRYRCRWCRTRNRLYGVGSHRCCAEFVKPGKVAHLCRVGRKLFRRDHRRTSRQNERTTRVYQG